MKFALLFALHIMLPVIAGILWGAAMAFLGEKPGNVAVEAMVVLLLAGFASAVVAIGRDT